MSKKRKGDRRSPAPDPLPSLDEVSQRMDDMIDEGTKRRAVREALAYVDAHQVIYLKRSYGCTEQVARAWLTRYRGDANQEVK